MIEEKFRLFNEQNDLILRYKEVNLIFMQTWITTSLNILPDSSDDIGGKFFLTGTGQKIIASDQNKATEIGIY